ncbi:Panacea domain-containing protein [Lactococcus formosensis]|uniref:Panacea domain-containing protein n=1 Tax=Lactococcus formosensis TaxID=1281486 RepID=UPI0032648C0B
MEFEKQTPMAVANYAITYAKENKIPISNLQLQKVLYYLQAAFLYKYDQELFEGKFERWDYGPVQQEVYNTYRDCGAMLIEMPAPKYSFESGRYDVSDPEEISPSVLGDAQIMGFLRGALDKLLTYKPWELVKKTHEQSLWADYEEQIKLHSAPQYDNEEIRKFFKADANEKERLWQQQV